MKKKLEYVMSAMSMTGITRSVLREPEFEDRLVKALQDVTKISQKYIDDNTEYFDHSIGILFNAFTERTFTVPFGHFGNYGAENVYADSGGLQIVTTGKAVTDEIKMKIYETQTYSDLAMCFDVIALDSVAVVRSSQERTSTGNKVFNEEKHEAAGIATGQNIRQQVEYFQQVGAKTKVIIIVQGNDHQDMVDFFDNIASQLEDHHYANIGGFAVADTCMGNKELESIDMMRAAHIISNKCHPAVNQQLHLLGVGSITRMAPTIQLMQSKYLEKIEKISYDSSSHTMSFNNGMWVGKDLSNKKNKRVVNEFRRIYDFYSDVFEPLVSFDTLVDEVLFNEEGKWAMSVSSTKARELDTVEKRMATCIFPYAYTMYLVSLFVKDLDEVDVERSKRINNAFKYLKQVDDEDGMANWLDHFKKYITSSRIKRSDESAMLDKFFG